jgi:hypothetical protein
LAVSTEIGAKQMAREICLEALPPSLCDWSTNWRAPLGQGRAGMYSLRTEWGALLRTRIEIKSE